MSATWSSLAPRRGDGAGDRGAEPRRARNPRLRRSGRYLEGDLHPRAEARRSALSGADGAEPGDRVLLALIRGITDTDEGGPATAALFVTAPSGKGLAASAGTAPFAPASGSPPIRCPGGSWALSRASAAFPPADPGGNS